MPKLSKTVINFWVDVLLLILFAALGGVSAVLQFIFPIGTAADGWTLWGAGYVGWRDLQFGVLCAFGLTVVLHVMLHWDWICVVFAKNVLGQRQTQDDTGVRTLYGVALLIVILGSWCALLIAALFTIQSPATRTAKLSPRNAAREWGLIWEGGHSACRADFIRERGVHRTCGAHSGAVT